MKPVERTGPSSPVDVTDARGAVGFGPFFRKPTGVEHVREETALPEVVRDGFSHPRGGSRMPLPTALGGNGRWISIL
jgi:hypothetical protein